MQEEFEKSIIVQLIQSANLLIHNLNTSSSKEYLLKTRFYKEIISYPFDFTDDEIVENYMSLLKGLAVNLDVNQLKEYLLDTCYTLFTGAMMFFNYSESLIKTASRAVVLHVLCGNFYLVNDEVIDKFVLESGFFYNLVSNLKESIINIVRSTAAFKSISKLESVIAESLDLLYHYNDIFGLEREIFSVKLSEVLYKDLVLPILAGSLIAEKLKPYHISIPISLLILSHMISILKYPALTESLISLLFHKKIWENYYEVICSPPNRDSPPLQRTGEKRENPVRLTILSFLQCKEDNLTGLSLILLQSALTNATDLILLRNSENAQEIYSETIRILQEIIMTEANFRFFTLYLACKVLLDLASIANSDHARIEYEIVKYALQKHSENMLNLLNTTASPAHVISVFEEEWEFVKKLLWFDRLELPLNYLLPAIDEVSALIPLENRRCVTDEDSLHNTIRLYLMHRKLKFLVIPSEIPEGLNFEISPLQVLTVCNLQKSETYKATSGYLKGKQIEKVIIKGFGFNNTTKYIIIDPNFFVLAQITPDQSSYFIEIVVRFSKVFVKDKAEPNMILLMIDQQFPLLLAFADQLVWLSVRNKFLKREKECKENELRLLKNFVQEAN